MRSFSIPWRFGGHPGIPDGPIGGFRTRLMECDDMRDMKMNDFLHNHPKRTKPYEPSALTAELCFFKPFKLCFNSFFFLNQKGKEERALSF